jgi:hypothetical protein
MADSTLIDAKVDAKALPMKPCPDCGIPIKLISKRCSGCCAKAQAKAYGARKRAEKRVLLATERDSAIALYHASDPAARALVDKILSLHIKPADLIKKELPRLKALADSG